MSKVASSYIWVFGSGDCGQLALDEDTWSAQVPTPHPFFVNKPIKQISAGGLHTLALGHNGVVYSWGCNDEQALGHEEPEFHVGMVRQLPSDIIQVAAGDSISAALTSDGKIYTWGTFRDSKGLLGHNLPPSKRMKERRTTGEKGAEERGNEEDQAGVQKVPTLLSGLPSVKSISAGSNHLFAITHAGELYSWGCGEQGQLGRRVLERHKQLGLRPMNVTPRSGRSLAPISLVCAGAYHTLMVTQDGRQLLATGLNNYGQLGTGTHEDYLTVGPVDVLNEGNNNGREQILALAAGEHHSLVLTSGGRLYAAGRNDAGELGIPHVLTHSNIFVPVPLDEPVKAIAAGGHHTLTLSVSGRVHAWGYGEMHQLGLGHDEIVRVPTPLSNLDFGRDLFEGGNSQRWFPVQVACGAQHSVIMTSKSPNQ